jgi:hypothetical protein
MPALWETATDPMLEFVPAPAPEERIKLCALLALKMLKEAVSKGLRAELDIGPSILTVHVWDDWNLWSLDICTDRLSYGKRHHGRDFGWVEDGAGRRCVICGSETGDSLCDRCFLHNRTRK